jgi:hypothetical protein
VLPDSRDMFAVPHSGDGFATSRGMVRTSTRLRMAVLTLTGLAQRRHDPGGDGHRWGMLAARW